jgi:hypothetical protein
MRAASRRISEEKFDGQIARFPTRVVHQLYAIALRPQAAPRARHASYRILSSAISATTLLLNNLFISSDCVSADCPVYM